MTEEKTAEIVENTEKNGSACLKSRGDLARELFKEGYNQCHLVKLIGSLRGKPLTKIYKL